MSNKSASISRRVTSPSVRETLTFRGLACDCSIVYQPLRVQTQSILTVTGATAALNVYGCCFVPNLPLNHANIDLAWYSSRLPVRQLRPRNVDVPGHYKQHRAVSFRKYYPALFSRPTSKQYVDKDNLPWNGAKH